MTILPFGFLCPALVQLAFEIDKMPAFLALPGGRANLCAEGAHHFFGILRIVEFSVKADHSLRDFLGACDTSIGVGLAVCPLKVIHFAVVVASDEVCVDALMLVKLEAKVFLNALCDIFAVDTQRAIGAGAVAAANT